MPAEGADLVAVDRFVDWFADGASAVQVATGGNSDGQSVEADWVKVGDAPVANPVDADDCKSSGDAISGHVPSRPVATPARQHGTLRKEKFRTFSAEEKASAQPWLVTCIELAELNTNVSGGLNN